MDRAQPMMKMMGIKYRIPIWYHEYRIANGGTDLDHLVISDGQCKPQQKLEHWYALRSLIRDIRPKTIINIGDFWDFPSLSEHDKGTIYAQNQDYMEDIEAGNVAKDILMSSTKGIAYDPTWEFFEGNHEHRVKRYTDKRPELIGAMNFYADVDLDGRVYNPFLVPKIIDGVSYAHYFYNPMNGRPYSGTVSTMLKNIGYSFVMGHQQRFGFDRRDLTNGNVIMGLVTGSYYMHDERYKGPQGNHHWQGVVHLKNVKGGVYDLETYSLDRILKAYT